MKKIMEKISNFEVGDLVNIKPNQWSARLSGTGIIVEMGLKENDRQSIMFPVCSVLNIKTSEVERIYLYNLELLSASR